MTWTLGGTAIPYPTEFPVEIIDIKYADRVASGKMVVDLIAKKRRFTLVYEDPELADLVTFLTLKALDAFLEFVYVENGVEVTKTVWMGDISYEGEYVNPETWKNVEIPLEEQ